MTQLSKEDRLRQLIAQATGPAPWYWQSFPTLEYQGRQFRWQLRTDGPFANVPVLEEEGTEQPVFAVNIYSRVFAANPGYLTALWVPLDGPVMVQVWHVGELRPLLGRESNPGVWAAVNPAEQVKHLQGANSRLWYGVWAAIAPVEQVKLADRLPEGRHAGPLARFLDTLTEVLLVAHGPPRPRPNVDTAACSIYAWQPATGLIDVLPQYWFTERTADLGYQWITRVARDPETGHIVGDGIRVAAFELDSSGTQVLRFLAPPDRLIGGLGSVPAERRGP